MTPEQTILKAIQEDAEIRKQTHGECAWKEDDEVGWKTDCGEAFVFNDDGPRENRFSFCPYCGGVLKL